MTGLSKLTLRKWRKLPWRDPHTDLYNLGLLQGRLAGAGISPTVANLRKRDLRKYLEWRQAALFSHFISEAVLKIPVAYSLIEEEDYDCVVHWRKDDVGHFAPVQLKEVVPKSLNPGAELNNELEKLKKYATPTNTVVAIHLNQSSRIEFSSIQTPKTTCPEIWIYGSLTPDQSRWFLYGNILKKPRAHEINYPAQPRAPADCPCAARPDHR